MRHYPTILLSLLAAAPPTAAQMHAAHRGWHLGAGVEVVEFGRAATTDAPAGIATEVRPTARPAFHLTIGRSYRSWTVELEAGWAGGHIQAGNDALTIQDHSSSVARYRLALGVMRRVSGAGPGVIGLGLTPTLDLWDVDGESRLRAGVEARILLRVPLGDVELENRIGVGASGNPIQPTDLGEGTELRGLRMLFAGVGLLFRT